VRTTTRRPPYVAVALVFLAAVAVSQAIPWASRAFGGNVPPLFARIQAVVGPGLPAVLLLAALGWWLAPRVLTLPRWVVLAGTVAFAWVLALALAAQSGGFDAISAPFRRPLDYFANVPLVSSLGPRTFAERYPDLIRAGQLSLHTSTHPPGAVLTLWGLSRLTGGSVLGVSILVALIGAAGTVPTYFLTRAVASERSARVAAALFVCAPGVLLFAATSMDAVFMTVVAVALAALVRAPRSDGWSFTAGVLAAIGLLFTFGAVALGLVAVGVGALSWRSEGPARLVRRGALAAGGVVVGAVLLRALVGVDLVSSFRASVSAHLSDPAEGTRPYAYWVVGNIVAFLISAGVAQTALLARETRERWRERRPGIEVALFGSLVVASLSGMFKGETDHIWLFFIPLLVAAAAPSVSGREGLRTAVAIGLAQAILMQIFLYTFW
jgi:methylthioxylose transferase